LAAAAAVPLGAVGQLPTLRVKTVDLVVVLLLVKERLLPVVLQLLDKVILEVAEALTSLVLLAVVVVVVLGQLEEIQLLL